MSLPSGWRRLFRHSSAARDVDDEIAFHIAMREETLRRHGLAAEDARTSAIARFGDRDAVREECLEIHSRFDREVRLMEWLASVASDFRFAIRSLRRTPAFTLAAALTLALGIGATSAMFTLVDGILLRPLPYPDPTRLVRLMQSYPEKGLDSWSLSQENVATFRDRLYALHQMQAFAGYSRRGMTLTEGGRPERLSGIRATGDFFAALGVAPRYGRVFDRHDDTPSTNDVAVLGYGLWQARFGGDPNVVGHVIDLDGAPIRIIGVMPSGFSFPRTDAQIYLPLGLDPSQRFGWFLSGVGRLAPGATIDEVRRSSTAIMQEWARGQPDLLGAGVDPRSTRMATIVTPLRDFVIGDSKRPLEVLQAAVALILLIATANVATLVSGRSSSRAREMAVRTALGATRGRSVRQLVTESVALALIAGVIGMTLAILLVRIATHSDAVGLPRLSEVTMNWRVVAFTSAITVGAGLAFGIAPALRLMRGRLLRELAGAQKSSARHSARRLDNTLLVAQIALAVVLLVSAGLVLGSFRNLLRTNLGFDPSGVTSIALPLPTAKYSASRATANAADAFVARVRALPGVADAAIAWTLPFSGNLNTDGYVIEGHAPPAGSTFETQTVQIAVGPGFFRTMRLPIRFGREFDASDREGSLPVTIVDETLANKYWRGADALGKRIRLTGDTTWRTIVGVAGAVRDEDVAVRPVEHSYFPFDQAPDNRPMLAVRLSGEEASTLASIRRTIAQIEPGVPLDNVRPLTSWIDRTLDTRRLTEAVLAGFALLAFTLAAVGVYGVMSLYVGNRYREFGIRLAIGAAPANVVALVLREGLTLVLIGLALGLIAAVGATHGLRTLLYGVSATDPAVYATISIALAVVAVAACLLPAWRAARSDPLAALRAE